MNHLSWDKLLMVHILVHFASLGKLVPNLQKLLMHSAAVVSALPVRAGSLLELQLHACDLCCVCAAQLCYFSFMFSL